MPVKGVINTIAGGPGGGDSRRERKRNERSVREDRRKGLVMNVETKEEIVFNSSDLTENGGSQDDPMVIKLGIANFFVHKVLIDNGSSADIIFWSVLRRMGLEDSSLSPVQTPLVGFGGSEVSSMGAIDLPVSMGEEPKRETMMIKFLVVDTPFAYNVILGQPGLNSFRAIVSTYHQKMKFPTKNGVGEVSCDQKEARRCYNLSLRKGETEERAKRKKREVEEEAEPKKFKAERMEPAEEYKSVELIIGKLDKTTRIGSSMSQYVETMMIELLRSNGHVRLESFGAERNRIIEEEVNKLKEAGYVSEIQYTDWLANVVVVPKASGKWRMCTDFTDLNKACPKDPYPLPRIDLLVDSTAGYELFSMMDAYQGYHQIFMAEEDRIKTSFIIDQGIYCYNVMPFGLKNAGPLKKPGAGIQDNASLWDEIKSKQVHIWSAGRQVPGVHGQQERDRSQPGKNRSDRKTPITQDIEGGAEANGLKSKWTVECEQALQNLKQYLATPPLLANPKVGEELFLYLAISDEAVSSVLVREQEKTQNPVYYVSKMLQGTEKRYTQIEKLALALVVTARKLRPYFQSHKVTVLTNHSLGHIMTRLDASGRLVKWAVELGEYDIEYQGRTAIKAQALADFIVEFTSEQVEEENKGWLLHVDGSSNANNGGAGILLQDPGGVEIEVAARLSFAATNNETEYEALILGLQLAWEAGARELNVCTNSQLVAMQLIPRSENERADALSKFGAMVTGIKSRKVTIVVKERSAIEETKEIQVVEEPSPWKSELMGYLKDAILPDDPIQAKRIKFKAARFTVIGDELYKRTIDGPLLKCVDGERAQYVLREIHEGSCGNHSGGRSLAQKVTRQEYFWPTLVKDATDFAKKCESCQRFAALIHTPATPMEPVRIACPFDQWGIDILGPFSQAATQKKFIVVAIEYFTK
ncbi:UNVERIFIED_CONTAM: Retrovirus-related Pol polyprotein from transposon gypsy [Sesamum latifolium]|uniref:Retrovirus-related Pol polyprotein from transposon gypsy n=1 Tax=Sesamum latifolium TaxID=2727402 RepID=A0AAW2U4H5_9LAMI